MITLVLNRLKLWQKLGWLVLAMSVPAVLVGFFYLRLAQSQQQQELIAYKQAIQLAFRDVSDALIGYQKYHQVRVEQQVTVKDLQDTVSTSLSRYRGGITT